MTPGVGPAEADAESRGGAVAASVLYSKVLDAAGWVAEEDPAAEGGDDAVMAMLRVSFQCLLVNTKLMTNRQDAKKTENVKR